MRLTRTLLRLVIASALTSVLIACERNDAEVPATAPAKVPSVSIMTFNVENLFDNVDDPGKNDLTYLPLAAKQSDEHKAVCGEIEVDHWRDQCLNWDWSDAII